MCFFSKELSKTTYDVYHELEHIGRLDSNDAFVKKAAKDKRLNMLVLVLSFDYLNTVIDDECKYLKIEMTF